jgi:hypothetical protein
MADGLTGPDLGALLRELKAVDAKATTLLRKNIRQAAKVAAEDVKREVQKPPPNDAPGTAGSRDAIAAGISVRINTGASSKSQGVAIVGSSKALPGPRKAMLRLYNKESWRHPVFAHSARSGGLRGLLGGRERVWVTQQGRPYFGAVLTKHTDDVQRAIQAAVDEANAALLRAK